MSIRTQTPDYYCLRLGTLDTPTTSKPSIPIFVADKANWDGLPQHDQWP